ncbi:hypothetical protein BKA58DRAFT_128319 [Alternaria rosae]|uniref:uncharacterized protein n=1 Tax=Alternaria rosae TaxID=1187941 RepID=UPI001E8DE258|nr:uncharacterized protein BKA58DRAFT_128319 [Alternaria rosae]KAH6875759.1 hypothetical protein BKA58DRAFT_128319 [Alternaria rosae]
MSRRLLRIGKANRTTFEHILRKRLENPLKEQRALVSVPAPQARQRTQHIHTMQQSPSRRGPPNRHPPSSEPLRGTHTGRGRGDSNPISDRGRGRGRGASRGRGQGRGRGRPNFRPDPDNPPVPSFAYIHPGTSVSIILKQDQPTGHQVRGIVADLLTRGDHPRGVKVRLRDGRVGRVQKLVSESEGQQGEAVVGGAGAGLGRDGEGGGGSSMGRAAGRMVGGRVERDIRDEDEYLYDEGKSWRQPADVGLFAALEEADRRHQGGGGADVRGVEVATCPVCGEFEGDEAAVAHHVEEHFGG